MKKARIDYFGTQITNFKNDSMNLFNFLKDLTGMKNERILPTKSSDREIAEEFSDFYVNKVLNIRKNIKNTKTLMEMKVYTGKNSKISSLNKRGFTDFQTIDMEKLKLVCSSLKKKTCSLDPIPTKILFEHMDILQNVILNIINAIITDSKFPDWLKHAVITPILKQSNLNPDEMKHFRPVSSIPFLCKIIEKVLYNQLDEYLEENKLYAYYQSAYRKHYSCESVLAKFTDDIQKMNNNGDDAVLILLDSSAAFDTVDH